MHSLCSCAPLMLLTLCAMLFPFLATFERALIFKAQSNITSCMKPKLTPTTKYHASGFLLCASMALCLYLYSPITTLPHAILSCIMCLYPPLVSKWEGYRFIYLSLHTVFSYIAGTQERVTKLNCNKTAIKSLGQSSCHLLATGAFSY